MAGCGMCGKALAYEERTRECEPCGSTVCLDCWRGQGCQACVDFPDGPLFDPTKKVV